MPGFTTRPEIRGTFGVVATTHWLASSVAMGVLEKGGNAFDAAVAAGFTLQVVEPHLNGPLGEAPILVYRATNRRADMICGQGVAPAAATIARFKSLGLDLIPGTGLLAAAVPGAFDGWMRLLRDYGTMPLPELIAPPLSYDDRGYTVIKGGPWSQGPVLLQQLALLEGFDLDGLDPVGPEFVHIVTECAKLAYADREAWYGDPNFVDVPMATLLSPAYNDARRKLVGEHASLELRPGSPDGRTPYVLIGGMEVAAAAGIGEPTIGMYDGIGEPTTSDLGVVAGDTCHLDIIDRWGNMVSATPSGGWLQSSPVIPELGFCLGTRLQISWLDEAAASSLAPGKRPRSTLSPTLALKDGEPWMAFGTPGGDGQDQWATQLFLHHVHHGMNLQEAIDCPEFNNFHAPSSFYPRGAEPGALQLEGRFPEKTARALAERGHKVRMAET